MTAFALALLLSLQPSPGADPKKVDEAIGAGLKFLRGDTRPATFDNLKTDLYEIRLLAFAHAGVHESDPEVQKYLKRILSRPAFAEAAGFFTYNVALTAMALEEVDRVRHQRVIALCGQYLIDNQSQDGAWGYGGPAEYLKDFRLPELDKPMPKRDGPGPVGEDGKPKVERQVTLRATRSSDKLGDNSNSQYAALGLRACHDAGIVLPQDVLARAEGWWRGCQLADPGLTRPPPRPGADPVRGAAAGWAYRARPGPAMPSMTAGGAGSLVIYDYLLKKDRKTDAHVEAGILWLARRWPNLMARQVPERAYLNFLYAVERLGVLHGTDAIGTHSWYADGANLLLSTQRPDGSWSLSANDSTPAVDTCWAILFLKRATRPFVATGGRPAQAPAGVPEQAAAPPPPVAPVAAPPRKLDSPKAVPLEGTLTWFKVEEDKDRVLVLESESNALVQISLGEKKALRKVVTGRDPATACLEDKIVWVANRGSSTLVKVDPEKGAVVETIALTNAPSTLLLVGKYLWYQGGDGQAHAVSITDKKEYPRFPRISTTLAYDARRDRLLGLNPSSLSEYVEGSKVAAIHRRMTGLAPNQARERQELFATLEKSARALPLPPQNRNWSMPYGFGLVVDEKAGRIYTGRCALRPDRTEAPLGRFGPAPHPLAADPAVKGFLERNPVLDEILAVSPDGKWVASGAGLYSATTFAPLKPVPVPSLQVSFSKDSKGLYYHDWLNKAIGFVEVESK